MRARTKLMELFRQMRCAEEIFYAAEVACARNNVKEMLAERGCRGAQKAVIC